MVADLVAFGALVAVAIFASLPVQFLVTFPIQYLPTLFVKRKFSIQLKNVVLRDYGQ